MPAMRSKATRNNLFGHHAVGRVRQAVGTFSDPNWTWIMKPTNSLRTLKMLAKRFARAKRMPQHQALDLIAEELEFAHWNALANAHKGNWHPTLVQIAKIENYLHETLPAYKVRHSARRTKIERLTGDELTEEGTIQGHRYRITESLGDVYMFGAGWSIHVPQSPNEAPRLEIAEQINHAEPIEDPDFQIQALEVAITRSEQVRASIASDWPRRSTKPDSDGRVRHPLFGKESDSWYCLHCNSAITGQQIADSLWHCPACKASPLDIFETAYWLDDGDNPPIPIQDFDIRHNPEPTIDMVDTRLKLELDADKITLLIRSALVEDATNVSERLGALFANIDVDEEHDIWITFDEDLWPETKEPVQALAVAQLLGIEVEQSLGWRELPFAWPGLGEHTPSTVEYTKMMLDAYAERRVDKSA